MRLFGARIEYITFYTQKRIALVAASYKPSLLVVRDNPLGAPALERLVYSDKSNHDHQNKVFEFNDWIYIYKYYFAKCIGPWSVKSHEHAPRSKLQCMDNN